MEYPEIHTAEYSVLAALRDGQFEQVDEIEPEIIVNGYVRAILKAVQAEYADNPDGDLRALLRSFQGGLRRFNDTLAATENAARQEQGARPEDNVSIPLVRAVDLLTANLNRKKRGVLIEQLAAAHRENDTATAARLAIALQDALENDGAEGSDAFKCLADFPNGFSSPEYLVEGIVPAESLGFIAGPPKVGRKTTLATALAVAVSGGGVWLGRPCKTGPVLFLAAEESDAVVADRIEKLMTGLDMTRDDRSRIWSQLRWLCGPRWTLDSAQGQGALLRAVRTYKPALLVIDPFTRMFTGDENDRGDVEPVLSFLKGLALRRHLAICVVHHAGKGAASGASPENMLRGSSALRGAHDFLVCSSPQKSGSLLQFELRYGEPFQLVAHIEYSHNPDAIEIAHEMSARCPRGDGASKLEDDVLAFIAGTPDATKTKIADGLKRSRDSISPILELLEKSGRIERVKRLIKDTAGRKKEQEVYQLSSGKNVLPDPGA